MPKLSPERIRRLLSDYREQSTNTFWGYYFEALEKLRKKILEDFGSGISYGEQKLRHLQGMNEAYKFAIKLPEKLVSELEKELK